MRSAFTIQISEIELSNTSNTEKWPSEENIEQKLQISYQKPGSYQ
jgi:hypothetical protein